MARRFGVRIAAVVALGGLIAAGCGDDGDSGATAATTTAGSAVAPTTTEKTPVAGGTLTFGQWAAIPSLDPAATSGVGTSGGLEIGAIYDRLVEWNPLTKKYDMKTAESLTPNATNTEWVLKVRPNIKFADGTAYDAAAVKINYDRQKTKNTNVRGLLTSITDVSVVDALTVKFTLNEPWGGFPIIFNNVVGNIVSPAAITALGDDGLKLNPVNAGAGPFQIESFKAGESITLKKNPTYWNGPVYLDSIKFVLIPGASATLDALKTGTLQAAFLRDAVAIAKAKADGLGNADAIASGGEMLILNAGVEVTCAKELPAAQCAGKPDGTKVATNPATKDLKVRQAIAAAIDTKAIDARANEGKGYPATSLFDSTFPWDPKVALAPFDVEKAKKLVTEAKAAGWNGKVRLTCGVEDQTRSNEVLTITTMLKNAGMDVDLTRANIKVSEQVDDVITKKDFDMACWGLQNTPDDAASAQIDQFLRSTSASNRTGYKNPTMDAALTELKGAGTDAARTAAYKKIADLWNTDLPGVPIFQAPQGVYWTTKVHGIKGTALSAAAFDKAWIER
ncbi:MAG: ABC transporter substrate-binding protein [Acidimicrobiales bacterium]